jgi:hypothetical protein
MQYKVLNINKKLTNVIRVPYWLSAIAFGCIALFLWLYKSSCVALQSQEIIAMPPAGLPLLSRAQPVLLRQNVTKKSKIIKNKSQLMNFYIFTKTKKIC